MKERKRMISEAARELGLETYHLRTWEDEFGILIPRNEKGYRCYGEKEIHMFQEIRDMKNEGLDTEEIKKRYLETSFRFQGRNSRKHRKNGTVSECDGEDYGTGDQGAERIPGNGTRNPDF